MAFRLPSQKKFKPSNKVVARKASIPASLAKQPSSTIGLSGTTGRSTSQLPSVDVAESPGPETTTQDAGLPPSIGPNGGIPTIGASQVTQPSPVFREPSLPPPSSRKRAASPTPSNASKSSRTGGRPTMIHLAASSGPARRPTASPSPSPQILVPDSQGSATGAPSASPSQPAPSSLPRVSPSLQRNTPNQKLSAPRPPPRVTVSPVATTVPLRSPPVQSTTLPAPSQSPVPSPSPVRAPSESSGMPPLIGSSIIDPVLLDQTPGAGPSREETAELAKALVAGIASQPAPPKRKRLTKMGTVPRKTGPKARAPKNPDAPARAKKKDKETTADGSVEPTEGGDEENAEATEPREGNGEAQPGVKKKRTYRRKPRELDEDGNPVRTPRPPYGSKGLAKTDKDGRLKHNREAKLAREAGFNTDDEVDEFAEDLPPPDPNQQIMGSFTRGFYDGDMTERALKLKEAQKLKREEALREKAEFERFKHIRLQPLRRRERAKRNEDRARRRTQAEAAGHEDEDVSEDEVDSTDEEYEFEPDRLTPPGTPEPENYGEEAGEDGQERNGEDEEQEGLGDVAAPEDEEEDVDRDEEDEEVDQPQDIDLGLYGYNVEEAEDEGDEGHGQPRDPDEADPDESALFNINPDEGELDEFQDDGQPAFSFADYTANREARRAAALATTNSRFVYTEDDDETRMINSTTWQKREKTDKWTDDETEFFYSVLSEVGENYGLMKAFFPGRSIAQIKKKGLRENAKNPEKVTQAILSRKPIDNRYLAKSAGYDPDRPWDAEEALFAEAKRDMAKLKAEDRGEEYVDDQVGEPDYGDDYGGVGDETMELDHDLNGDDLERAEDAGEGGGDEPAAAANDEGLEGPEDENQGDGALFLPGGNSP